MDFMPEAQKQKIYFKSRLNIYVVLCFVAVFSVFPRAEQHLFHNVIIRNNLYDVDNSKSSKVDATIGLHTQELDTKRCLLKTNCFDSFERFSRSNNSFTKKQHLAFSTHSAKKKFNFFLVKLFVFSYFRQLPNKNIHHCIFS